MKRFESFATATGIALLFGCGAVGDATTASTSAAATQLQSSASDHAQAAQCFADFHTCIGAAADSAAIDACRATLQGCLPARPDAPVGDDICNGPPPDHRGGPPHGDCPDGGAGMGQQPPPPPPPDGNGHQGPPPAGAPDGGMGAPMHCGFGGPAAKACKDQLDACLADSSNDPIACGVAAHTCMHDAIAANFKLACDHIVARCRLCAPSPSDCNQVAATCAAGVPFPDQP